MIADGPWWPWQRVPKGAPPVRLGAANGGKGGGVVSRTAIDALMSKREKERPWIRCAYCGSGPYHLRDFPSYTSAECWDCVIKRYVPPKLPLWKVAP